MKLAAFLIRFNEQPVSSQSPKMLTPNQIYLLLWRSQFQPETQIDTDMWEALPQCYSKSD